MYNVLIADDEKNICEGIAEFLDWQELGFHIIGLAANGEEALNMLSWQRCELILTDIRMPGIDGLALIRRIQEKDPGIKIIIVSGYSDFAYAKQAIEMGVKAFLLKPIDREELLAAVKKIKRELDGELEEYRRSLENDRIVRNQLFRELLSPGVSPEAVSKRLADQGVKLQGGRFLTAVLQPNFGGDKEAGLLGYSIKNIACELLELNDLEGYAFDYDGRRIGLLFCGGSRLESAAPAYLAELLSCVETYLHLSVSAGMGRPAESFGELRNSFEAALEDCGGKALLSQAREPEERPSEAFGLSWRSEGLLNALQFLEEETVWTETDRLLQEIAEKQIPEKVVRGVLYGVLFELMGLYQKYNIGYELRWYDEKLRVLEEGLFRHRETVKDFLSALCREALQLFRETSVHRPSNLVLQVQQYCEQNYSHALNLQIIARRFYMNPAYLGRLFKAETGCSFSDYLNRLRITAAKRQLAAGTGRVSELIETLGYRNEEYFYRQFRKQEGRSFAEYRRQLTERRKEA